MNEGLLLGPIVGGLSHSRALLWARAYPVEEDSVMLRAWLGRQPDLSDAQMAGQSWPLSSEQGFAAVVPIIDLEADTRYYYALTLDDTPPLFGAGPLESGFYPSFKTFPPPGARKSFAFAFGSCFQPFDEHGGSIFDALDSCRQKDNLRFVLMIGDQIYADNDECNGLGKIAQKLDEYRAVYAYVWTRPLFRKLLWNLPAFMTLDDHEVDNDWYWRDAARRDPAIPWWDSLSRLFKGCPPSERKLTLERVQNALQAYWEHQGMHAPPLARSLVLNQAGQYALTSSDPGSLAYTFECGAVAFFVLDTRSMRVKGSGVRTMLGEGQWRVLEEWLLRVKDAYPVKFLVSSSALLYQMWADLPRDRWVGFPKERDRLLNFIAANDIRNLYLLAGDLHAAHAVRAELYGPGGSVVPLWEFCSSPFEQETNWLATVTRYPLLNGLCKNQKCEFSIDELNFGVIKVAFNRQGQPNVRFELYGSKGQLLAYAGERRS